MLYLWPGVLSADAVVAGMADNAKNMQCQEGINLKPCIDCEYRCIDMPDYCMLLLHVDVPHTTGERIAGDEFDDHGISDDDLPDKCPMIERAMDDIEWLIEHTRHEAVNLHLTEYISNVTVLAKMFNAAEMAIIRQTEADRGD